MKKVPFREMVLGHKIEMVLLVILTMLMLTFFTLAWLAPQAVLTLSLTVKGL